MTRSASTPPSRSNCRIGRTRRRRAASICLAAALPGIACDGGTGPESILSACTVPESEIKDAGTLRDSIPTLTNPDLRQFGDPRLFYLSSGSRVVGFTIDSFAVAVPHNILWWHEIVNFELPTLRLSVTYSPFTGTAFVLDRAAASVDSFEVSEFLFNNNLVMRDETGSLWPQITRSATCGTRKGVSLGLYPAVESTLGGWLGLHRDSWIVTSVTGFDRLYTLYPYGDYEQLNNPETPFPVTNVDRRVPPKERVVGIPGDDGGIAYPFRDLFLTAGLGMIHVENAVVDGEPLALFWNSNGAVGIVYRAELDGQRLTFEMVEFQRYDIETGSRWNIRGQAVSGPLAGRSLEHVKEAYVGFWFAWAEFHPNTRLWQRLE